MSNFNRFPLQQGQSPGW